MHQTVKSGYLSEKELQENFFPPFCIVGMSISIVTFTIDKNNKDYPIKIISPFFFTKKIKQSPTSIYGTHYAVDPTYLHLLALGPRLSQQVLRLTEDPSVWVPGEDGRQAPDVE